MGDVVDHPAHYNTGKIEVIDYIEDKKLGYHLGNAVKYISRAGVKNPDKYIEDLKKAAWYINREISVKEGNPMNNSQVAFCKIMDLLTQLNQKDMKECVDYVREVYKDRWGEAH